MTNMQNLLAVSHPVCASVYIPKILRTPGTSPSWDGGMADSLETRVTHHLCYHAKCGRPRSKYCIGVDRGSRKFRRTLEFHLSGWGWPL